ncbi:hypothetical protein GCM10018793_57910 [Streptomyces sulfonofaciens]|uniref:Uncharacterized protein n=1 Tax=Streptomyces sulfonofaciens TaxID=68272 RepID=A0A919GMC2_9ACTN|nr:hypothetical protein [Streptomyces sulfonofaciens]GHH86355.1 hypothetical protein GCM10018793_57910 [Streptomyces sulfonofaciens]
MYASGHPGPARHGRAAPDPDRYGGGRGSRPLRLRFDGWIAGIGTSCGTRIVLGHWERSPFGAFSDVMLERADGERLLLAPTRETADFVSSAYAFEAVRLTPVDTRVERNTWAVTAGPLDLSFTTGRPGPLGLVLHAVPGAVAGRPAWATLMNPPARLLLTGVRTRGRVGAGARGRVGAGTHQGARPGGPLRRQWYGARDLRPIVSVSALFEGVDLGGVAPVAPAVRFGFGSVPRTPALARITTTMEPAPG